MDNSKLGGLNHCARGSSYQIGLGGTHHVLALRTTEPAISNVYFMVRTSLTEEKALVLRLNSFWGILTVFVVMEITEEAFTRLNTAVEGITCT